MSFFVSYRNSLIVKSVVLALGFCCTPLVHAEYPSIITNKYLPKPIASAARQCSASGDKVVFSNLDLTSQEYVFCPEPPKRWAILDSNANELIAPELAEVDAPVKLTPARVVEVGGRDDLIQSPAKLEKGDMKSVMQSFSKIAKELED